jgi:hypothetical protein
MSCGANRCALRRFDGHGSSTYRPSNPEQSKAFNSNVQAMLAERARQDAGIFSASTAPTPIPAPVPIPIPAPVQHPLPPTHQTYYSLSDANK